MGHSPDWFLSVICGVLRTDDWANLEPPALDGLLRALRRSLEAALQVATRSGWSPMEVDLLGWLLVEEDEHSSGTIGSLKIVRLRYYPLDWLRGLPGSPLGLYAEEPPPTSRLGRLLHAIVRFGSLHTPAALRNLVETLDVVPLRLLEALPGHVRAQIPIDFQGDVAQQIAVLRTAPDKELWQLLRDEKLRRRSVARPVSAVEVGAGELNLDEWKRFATTYPSIALKVISDSWWSHGSTRPSSLDSPAAIRILIRALIESPESLLAAPGQWGRLIKTCPGDEAKIRKAILSVAGQRVRSSGRDTEFQCISLILPRDGLILPHVVGPLLAHGNLDSTSLDMALMSIAQVDQLHRFARDSTQAKEARLAAHLLTWVHPEDSVPLGDEELLDLITSESLPWLLPAFAMCIRLLHQPQSGRRFAGNMLRHIRTKFDVRELLDPLLHLLRETSNGPMTKARVANPWLKLSGTKQDGLEARG